MTQNNSYTYIIGWACAHNMLCFGIFTTPPPHTISNFYFLFSDGFYIVSSAATCRACASGIRSSRQEHSERPTSYITPPFLVKQTRVGWAALNPPSITLIIGLYVNVGFFRGIIPSHAKTRFPFFMSFTIFLVRILIL